MTTYYVDGAAGNDTNGGTPAAFNRAGTDGASTAASTTFTSATAAFVAGDVGQGIWVGAAAPVFALISSVTGATTVVLSKPFATTQTGLSFRIGGAVATLGVGVALLSPAGGDTLNVKASATYTLTAPVAVTSLAGTIAATTTVRGYGTTPGDGTRPLVTSSSSGVDLFSLAGCSFVRFESLHLTHTGATRGNAFIGVTSDSNHVTLVDILIDGCLYGVRGDGRAFANLVLAASTVKNCTGGGVTNYPGGLTDRIVDCLIYNNAGNGYDFAGSSGTLVAVGTTFAGNGYGVYDNGSSRSVEIHASGCTFAGHAHDAVRSDETRGSCILYLSNNLFYGNTTTGVNLPTSTALARLNRYNIYGGNGTDRTNLGVGVNDLSGVNDPFVSSAGGDYRLNAAAGGGLLVRAAGFPGTYPGAAWSGYRDVGAVQHQDAGPSVGRLLTNSFQGGLL